MAEEVDSNIYSRESQAQDSSSPGPSKPQQSPEKIEAVLNQGLEFMSGLLEMATGQKLTQTKEDKPVLKVDPQSGEVTMKFRLPGF